VRNAVRKAQETYRHVPARANKGFGMRVDELATDTEVTEFDCAFSIE